MSNVMETRGQGSDYFFLLSVSFSSFALAFWNGGWQGGNVGQTTNLGLASSYDELKQQTKASGDNV